MLELEIEPGTKGLVDALRWVRAFADSESLDERRAYAVALVAEEILTNIAKHGSPRSPIRLRVSRGGPGLTLRFEDDGAPFDPTTARAPAAPPLEGGRGLALVQRTARSLEYRREGGRNVLVVSI